MKHFQRSLGRALTLLAVLILVGLFITPVLADNHEPALPPPLVSPVGSVPALDTALTQTEIILVVGLVIAVVIISVFSATILSLAKQGFNALPPWAADLVRDGSRRGVLELEEIVADTPNTIDDELARLIRDIVEEVVSKAVQDVIVQVPVRQDE